MKKRTIITILLTIICIALSNKMWLIFKPIDVNFNISGNGKYKISALLNKNNDENFNKSKESHKTIDLSNINQNVSIDVYRSKFPKRVKLVFLAKNNQKDSVYISKINLLNGKINLNNSEFKTKNCELEILNDKIKIIPNEKKFELIYKTPLSIRCAIKFEFGIFLSILILSFLLFYKLTSYLADFKNIKNKSRIEIIFLTVFFVFLFIPMSHINNDKLSKQENRTLAKKPNLIQKSGEINYEFGKQFNEWFNDRFGVRNLFINTSIKINYYLTGYYQNNNVIVGQDGWLFGKRGNRIRVYQNLDYFTESELNQILDYLVTVDNFCKSNKKQFYFVIPPDKSRIYGEYYPTFIAKSTKLSRAEQLVKYIKDNSNIDVLYLKEDLIKSKNKGLLYYKNDSHWSKLGSYVGYNIILDEMNKKNNIKPVSPKKINYEKHAGDLQKSLNNAIKYDDSQEYETFEFETNYDFSRIEKENTKVENDNYNDVFISKCNDCSPKTLVVYRDSFGMGLLPYLSQTFKEVYYNLWKDYSVKKSDVLNYDIVLLECVERYLPDLLEAKLEN